MSSYLMLFIFISALVCALGCFFVLQQHKKDNNGGDGITIHAGSGKGASSGGIKSGSSSTTIEHPENGKKPQKNVESIHRNEIITVYRRTPKQSIAKCSICDAENETRNQICRICGNELR